MITGEYEQLKDLADTNVCADDKGHLTVGWNKEKGCYHLICQHDHEVKGGHQGAVTHRGL